MFPEFHRKPVEPVESTSLQLHNSRSSRKHVKVYSESTCNPELDMTQVAANSIKIKVTGVKSRLLLLRLMKDLYRLLKLLLEFASNE